MEYHVLLALVEQKKSIRTIAKHTGKSPTSIRYWLKKHNLSSQYVKPFILHICGTCGDTNPNNFYGAKKQICGKCHNKYTLTRGQNNRKAVIDHMGGKCISCGFEKYECSLQIHHLDSSVKDPKFSNYRGWAWEKILEEISGCVLLCGNCHPAVHRGYIDIDKLKEKLNDT